MFAYATPSSFIEWAKFEDLIIANGRTYVRASTINDLYKRTNHKANSTPKKLISDLQIESYIRVKHTPKNLTKDNSLRSRFLSKFKLQSRTVYLPISELDTPKEGANKQNHIELLRMINMLPELKSVSVSGEQEESIDEYNRDSFLSINTYFEIDEARE
jgi:hypothetical protein